MKRYDKHPSNEETLILENLPEGALFKLKNGLTYRKGPKGRTRYRCECLDNGKTYTISGMAEIKNN